MGCVTLWEALSDVGWREARIPGRSCGASASLVLEAPCFVPGGFEGLSKGETVFRKGWLCGSL